MSKQRKTAASVTAPAPAPVTETTEVVQVVAPEAIPVAEVEAPAPETAPAKTKLGRDKLREMGVGLVFEDEVKARESKPTFVPAEGSAYDLYKVSNGVTYWTWSIDSRRAYEHVCRHLGFEAEKADKPVRQSAVTAIKDENAMLKAKQADMDREMEEYRQWKARQAEANGAAR
jgi:hypothetical protein